MHATRSAEGWGSFFQLAAWLNWVCWTILTGLCSVSIYRYHKQEDFFTSMTRERQRLLQSVVGDRDQIT